MKVIGINGSARKDGNTAIIMRIVFGELEKQGIETEMIQLAGSRIESCRGCLPVKEKGTVVCQKTHFMNISKS